MREFADRLASKPDLSEFDADALAKVESHLKR